LAHHDETHVLERLATGVLDANQVEVVAGKESRSSLATDQDLYAVQKVKELTMMTLATACSHKKVHGFLEFESPSDERTAARQREVRQAAGRLTDALVQVDAVESLGFLMRDVLR
jgi:hypothetical protein